MIFLRKEEKKTPYLFLFPALIVIAFVFLYPVGRVAYDSFFATNGTRREFVGLGNYAWMFKDKLFWQSVLNNLKLFLTVPPLIVLSLFLSIVLFYRIPGWKVYRVLLLFPYIISVTVVGIIFDYLLREDGMVNNVLAGIGLGSWVQPWIGQPSTALYTIMVVVIWKELGFGIILFLARLLSVDKAVIEAANLDGATPLKASLHILLPELKSVLSFYIILCLINMLSWMFNYVFVMTRGGPQNSTYILEYYIYQMGIKYHQYGISSVLAVFLLIFAMLLVVIQFFVKRTIGGEENE